jgi:uncharacterized protein YfaS (alpha-2-macroglobulin family)
MEQTSSAAYPNVLVADYVKKARVANPQILMKAEQYLNIGYQKLLTFERPGGGFDWWGNGDPLVWLSAYALQEFSDMARVYPIDRGVIDRTQAFLMKQMDAEGTWANIGPTHEATLQRMGHPKLLLTSYVVWSLLESGHDKKALHRSIAYIRKNLGAAGDNAYILALAANALAAHDPTEAGTREALDKLHALRQSVPDWHAVHFPTNGMSLTYSHGDSVTIETTALAALAMIRSGAFTSTANQALTYLIKSKAGNGTWGSTQATILSLKALIAGMRGPPLKGTTHFTIAVNGQEAARGKVDEDSADLMQTFDLKGLAATGANRIEIAADGETNLMYQVVGRYYEPWGRVAAAQKPVLEMAMAYDRTRLETGDLLHAQATLKYHGRVPTYMVMLDLGIPPGFAIDPEDFARMSSKKQIQKFSVTARTVTVYLGDVQPGDVLKFDYSLRARLPIRAKTPPAAAYEYYTPANRAEAAPVELVAEERRK